MYGPIDAGYPVGYFALISDPDDHTLEVSHGQEVGRRGAPTPASARPAAPIASGPACR